MSDRVHVAGAPVGAVQKCAECGLVLVDYSSGQAVTGEAGRLVEARPLFYGAGSKVLEVSRGGIKVQTHDGTPASCAAR